MLLALQGYDSRFAPMNPGAGDYSHFGSDVTFIGHYERHYSACLRAANRGGHKLRIWGPGWPRYALLHPWTKLPVEGNGVWGREYPIALGCSKIALGLLSKRFPETTTTRTFEIPAIGVFLLAERTEDHLQLFTEGVEAEYFGSETELRDKIGFYLRHDEARQKIARAGRERCIKSGYDAESQLRKLLTQIA
ncbi:MAG: hypothetical protein C5B60_07575 [Chloroflexi bacterium]|nr:MAG: hypothetical protein C5B60_07575 [Chloroflexota bacterium]